MREKYPGAMTASLGEGRLWLMSAREERDGAECPCCGQMAKIYSRSINGAMAHALMLVAFGTKHGQADDDGWIHITTFLNGRTGRVGDGGLAKLRYWGLVEGTSGGGDDDRRGYWRITEKGLLFVLKRLKLPKYALVYDGTAFGYDGPDVGISECLGKKFDYEEILRAPLDLRETT